MTRSIRWISKLEKGADVLAKTVLGLVLLALAAAAQAQPGTQLAQISLPVKGSGVSVAADCSGNIYYTNSGADTQLHKMDKNGSLLGSVPIVDAGSGAALAIDEIAWDPTRSKLWGCLHNSNPVKIYLIDLTGSATFQFNSSTNSMGSFRDGLAYDGSDDSLWISGDVSTTVEHHAAATGASLGQITPKGPGGGSLSLISGVVVGLGDLLYLGQDGQSKIVQVKKSNGDFISSFASPGGTRDEGLECDSVNFAPKLALLSREFTSPGFISAIEIADGTCACGGRGATGILKVCKVAGPGIAVGTPFTFTAGSSTFTVPAGPPPGGTCVVGPSFAVGSVITIIETIPAGDTVSSIGVAPAGNLVGLPNLAAGTVDVTIGSGITEVTYVDKRTGFLEICKKGIDGGPFTFYVNPGGLGPFVIRAGTCSPAIEVPAGSVIIHEMPGIGSMIGCSTIPPGQQGACNLNTQTSTVTVSPGDVSAQTIAFISNGAKPGQALGPRPLQPQPHVTGAEAASTGNGTITDQSGSDSRPPAP